MINHTISFTAIATLLSFCMGQAVASEPQYLKLIDKLDRPNDGYCFDVPGVIGNFRADKPLVAHNCKPGSAPDGLIEHTDDDMLLFSEFIDQCVTAMGTGSTVLPGTSLMLMPCIQQGAFASSAIQKRFKFNEKKQLELIGSSLCVVVGDRSAQTFSSRDRWRTLYLNNCNAIPLERSQWELVAP